MTDPDIVVIGGANVDYLIKGPRLPSPGDTVEGGVLHEAAGGKGANQAIAAARLGASVAFVGRVGNDERGLRILARLSEEGVDVNRVATDAETATGVALIMVDGSGEKAIMTAPGANRRLSPVDVDAAAAVIARARVVLLQLEAELPTVDAAVRVARSAGARVVLDAAPAVPLADALLAGLDVVRCNGGEAEVLTGIPVRDRGSAQRAAQQLIARGAGAACIGAGAGDLLCWRGGEQWLPHLPVDVVDATGAGDAFAAALAVGLADRLSLADAGWLGCAAAALATTVVGAQAGLPTRSAVEHLLATHR